jgi:hypothetical protein
VKAVAPLAGTDPYGNRRYAVSVPRELAEAIPMADRVALIERKGLLYDLQPSVTSVESALHRPALHAWKQNRMVEWIMDNLTEVAESLLLFDKEVVAPGVVRKASAYKPEADLGTRVHSYLEQFVITGEIPDGLPDVERPFVEAGIEYWTTQVAELVAVEAVVWRPGETGYAGRVDNIVVGTDGMTRLVDWKVSTSHEAPWRAWPNHSRQQMCYARAPWIYLDGEWQSMPAIKSAHLVYLTADGEYAARDADLSDRTWSDFLTIRKAYELAFPKWRA